MSGRFSLCCLVWMSAGGIGCLRPIHIPLYLLLFWGLLGTDSPNANFMRGLDIFFAIHVGLHLLYLRHPQNEFTSLFSWALILGAGVFGLLDLLIW
ncbi:MAG: DUF6713 family protein [Chloroflexota bacterium]